MARQIVSMPSPDGNGEEKGIEFSDGSKILARSARKGRRMTLSDAGFPLDFFIYEPERT